MTFTSNVNLDMLFGFYKPHFPTFLSGRLMHVTEYVVQFKQVIYKGPDTAGASLLFLYHLPFPVCLPEAALLEL